MTYRDLCIRLQNGGIDNPEWDAACLLQAFCDASLLDLRVFPERDYASDRLDGVVARRLSREPLQYILGEWDFYRQTYEVSPSCLIPRADTEILVEEAIRLLPSGAFFADLCTGSGCIAVSTLAERPDTRAVALDKFSDTLALAKRNAQRNGVDARAECILGDVLASPAFPDGCFDAILSNPPYIATGMLSDLSPEVCSEPTAALDGGTDGLTFYRSILKNWSRTLKPNGFLLFEIGYDQADALRALGAAYGFAHVTVKKDLGGNDRVVYLSQKPYPPKGKLL